MFRNSLFKVCEIAIIIEARNGEISKTDLENRMEETIKQTNAEILEKCLK